MEISTIIGIVVAIIICIVGLRMILRKPNDAEPSLESELHVNQDSNQPVIPRHVRDQLQKESADSTETKVADRIEPSLNADAESVVQQSKVEPSNEDTNIESKAENGQTVSSAQAEVQVQVTSTANEQLTSSELNKTDDQVSDTTTLNVDDLATADVKASSKDAEDSEVSKILKEPEFTLNPNVQTAEIKDFEEESSILDVHLHEQQRFDDESELAKAEHIISLNVYPNPRKALSGDKTLKVLLKYGLRFGEMNCFHRYEDPEKVSPLMFSVLRITEEGPAGFDLEALSVEQVKGLAFFLALPHQNVQKGYDSMVSIAGLIARETDGTVYDENNLEFTPQLKEHWRHKAIDYRPGQEV